MHQLTKIIILIFVNLIFCFSGNSQDEYSWNDLVDWNGYTHWTRYLIISPGYFGPNALPVPELRDGTIRNEPYFEMMGTCHFSKGDNTGNLFLKYYHPFAKNKVAIELSFIPIEYYNLSADIRDQRKIRNEDPKGLVVGDFVFGTIIQLTKDREKFPDLTLEMFCKTTSGGRLDDARYTDHPAYYFYLNFGKNIRSPDLFDEMRWYGSIGFYNWQTNMTAYLQNDAPAAAIGLQVNKNNFEIHNQICGYYGYISYKYEPVVKISEKPYLYDGDQPFVYRFQMLKKYGKYNLKFCFQQGINDYKYTSFSIGVQYFSLKK